MTFRTSAVMLGFGAALAATALLDPATALAQGRGAEGNEPGGEGCNAIDRAVDQSVWTELNDALAAVVALDQEVTGGLDNNMWGAIVDQHGIVCAIAFTGDDINDQWLGSRAIAAQKANTAVLFSLNAGAGGTIDVLSTANLYSAVQPGGSLFGLQFSNPVNPSVAYGDNTPGDQETSQGADTTAPPDYGTRQDPMVGEYIGGINVFGGGLTLYGNTGRLIGGLGVSGDTSCADHNIAWLVRNRLGLDNLQRVTGLGPDGFEDNIIYDIGEDGISQSGFGHPECGFGEVEAAENLPATGPAE